MNSITYSIWQLLTGLLIPESLANQHAINITLSSINNHSNHNRQFYTQLIQLKQALKPGDLLIVRTPGQFYRLFRLFTGHKFDHLAIVMNNNEFLHVGPPDIRLLPIELLLQPNRKTIVLRPKLKQNELNQLLLTLNNLIGQKYDSIKVYSFIAKLAIQKFITGKNKQFLIKHPAIKDSLILSNTLNNKNNYNNSNDIHSFICTDAILSRLMGVSEEFRCTVESLNYLDYSLLKSWSINDVYNLAILKPNLLKQINLPPIDHKLFKQVNQNTSDDSNNNNNTNAYQQAIKAFTSLALTLFKQINIPSSSTTLDSSIVKLMQVYSVVHKFLPVQFHSSLLASLAYLSVKLFIKRRWPKVKKIRSKL